MMSVASIKKITTLGKLCSTNRRHLSRPVVGIGRSSNVQKCAFIARPPLLLLDETTFVHAKPASWQVQLVEIAVVVRYSHDRRAGKYQLG
jgi:hypothetical protein